MYAIPQWEGSYGRARLPIVQTATALTSYVVRM